jgi:hypothetical protein
MAWPQNAQSEAKSEKSNEEILSTLLEDCQKVVADGY